MTLLSGLLAATTPETTFDVPANVVFAVMAVFMIAAAIRVVTTKNIVHAALWLIIVLGGVGVAGHVGQEGETCHRGTFLTLASAPAS